MKKSSLFKDDMILYTKDPKNYTRPFLKPVNTFNEVAGHTK